MLKRFYLEDHDKEVICQEMHLSEAAFNQALSRARRRFRQILEERGFTKRDLLSSGYESATHRTIRRRTDERGGSAAFEDYCLANPEFARQVEFEQRLKAGLTLVASGSTAEFVRSNDTRCAGTSPPQPASCSRSSRCSSRGPAVCRRRKPLMAAVTSDSQRRRPVACAWRWCAAPKPRRSCRRHGARRNRRTVRPGISLQRRARPARAETI